MRRSCVVLSGLALAVALACASPAAAQASGAPADDPQKLAELMRKDVRAGKADIIAKTMEMDADTAATFWPLYKQYEAELTKLGDEQAAIIRDYAKAWNADTLTDATAKDLLTRSLALDEKKLALQKKNMEAMLKALPAKTVARFYQVENRLNSLVGLSLSREIPLVY